MCGEIVYDTLYVESTPAIPSDCTVEEGC